MATLKNIKVGQILYDIHSYRSNGGMRLKGMWQVHVLEVHEDHAICSWNGNPQRRYTENQIKKLKVNKPKEKH